MKIIRFASRRNSNDSATGIQRLLDVSVDKVFPENELTRRSRLVTSVAVALAAVRLRELESLALAHMRILGCAL